ncbi:MAG TPA: YggT family protein [Candidatus Dormibacteraeota bacterium]|nr:YggT family protein [Candidatus Dormibacteraeota bacterium]
MHEIARVIGIVLYIETLLILVRVALSWFPGIDPWNPLVRFLRAVVDPVLRPFRSIMPTFGGIDFSPILAIIVLGWVSRLITNLADNASFDPGQEIGYALSEIVLTVTIVFCVVVLLRILISLFQADPWHPVVQAIRQMSNPLIRPFAAVVPRSRGVDLAAVVALVVYVVFYFVARRILSVWVLGL